MNPFEADPIHLYPVCESLLADTETPVSVYMKLSQHNHSYLFESVVGGEKWGRYSIIGLGCRHKIEINDQQVNYYRDGECIDSRQVDDPLALVNDYQQRFQVESLEHLPIHGGGLVGYFSYETIRYIEHKLANRELKQDTIGIPHCVLMVSTDVVVVDNLSGMLHLICYAQSKDSSSLTSARQAIGQWIEQLQVRNTSDQLSLSQPSSQAFAHPLSMTQTTLPIQFHSGERCYKQWVQQIKHHINIGDVMQVVPAHRMSCPFKHNPLSLYRALRHINPSPYMYFMNFAEFQIVGASPEILARLEDEQVIVRPIAGTRQRGQNEQADQLLEQELLADEKEIAEHLMLIDLARNDIGRVCQIGSVQVTAKMIVERYSHVMHIVSNVVGRIHPQATAVDVIRATFPAGTLSGAPKVRAMEIIDDLEHTQRGIYGGAVGYLGWHNNMDMAIAIRTAVIKNETAYFQAGGGIVADSDEQAEWQETLGKAQAIIKAIELAQQLSG